MIGQAQLEKRPSQMPKLSWEPMEVKLIGKMSETIQVVSGFPGFGLGVGGNPMDGTPGAHPGRGRSF